MQRLAPPEVPEVGHTGADNALHERIARRARLRILEPDRVHPEPQPDRVRVFQYSGRRRRSARAEGMGKLANVPTSVREKLRVYV